MSKQFRDEAFEQLGAYVYGLFDPEKPTIPFYVGKGNKNRVFNHADGVDDIINSIENTEEELLSAKNETILDIKRRGQNVHHVIFRWGLDDKEALSLEASLIDMVNFMHENSLTNKMSGHGVAQGFQITEDLVVMLNATQAEIQDPALIIKIEKYWTALLEKNDNNPSKISLQDIQTAAEGDWRISIDRVKKAKCILVVARGLVRAVFFASDWREVNGGRKRFTAHPAPEYQDLVGKSVGHLSIRGNQNPLKYVNC
jgi:uncharacterized protein